MWKKRRVYAKLWSALPEGNFTTFALYHLSAMLLLRPFFQLFWIGACALAMLWQTRLLVPDPTPSNWLAGFVFSATVFGYNFAASRWRRRVAWGIGFIGAWCFWHLSLAQQTGAIIPVLIWLLYYDIRHPERAGLRKYPALKPVAIAVAWAWVTVLLPLPINYWAHAAVLFCGRAAFIFALALAYDLCDRAYDRRQGFVTLVLQLGPRNTFRLIDAALLLSAVCCFLNFALGYYSSISAVALLISLMISRLAIRTWAATIAWGDWRKVAIDGLMVLQMMLVWISGRI